MIVVSVGQHVCHCYEFIKYNTSKINTSKYEKAALAISTKDILDNIVATHSCLTHGKGLPTLFFLTHFCNSFPNLVGGYIGYGVRSTVGR